MYRLDGNTRPLKSLDPFDWPQVVQAALDRGHLDRLPGMRRRRERPQRRVADPALAVAHDEMLIHAFAVRTPVHLGQVGGIGRPILEERVHVLDGVQPELAAREGGEVDVLELARAERAVQRPLGDGKLV